MSNRKAVGQVPRQIFLTFSAVLRPRKNNKKPRKKKNMKLTGFSTDIPKIAVVHTAIKILGFVYVT